MVLFQKKLVTYHESSFEVKVPKKKQCPDMAIVVDWDVKHQFKQTNKVSFNKLLHYVMKNLELRFHQAQIKCDDILLKNSSIRDFAIVFIPCNSSGKVALCPFFHFNTGRFVYILNVHVNHDLYQEQRNLTKNNNNNKIK